jgi:hypothetical protein
LILQHVYEVRPRKDKRGVDLISDALDMGNSAQVVKDHYFEIVDEKAAREYWSIKPLPQDGKIVAIA